MYLSYRDCLRSESMSAEGSREPVRTYDRSWSEIEDMLGKAIARRINGRSGLINAARTVTETE